jgi:pimeloyl-ACP methyl ester carboxylesterase/DNA-binding CsgD family transcriptional regulator
MLQPFLRFLAMPKSSERLIHLVYDASLDNSLWPELVLTLTEELERARETLPATEQSPSNSSLAEHFARAFSISERIVGLQEREGQLSAILNTFSFGLALIDEQGEVIMKNSAIMAQPKIARLFDKATTPLLRCPLTETEQSLKLWVGQINHADMPSALALPDLAASPLLMLPRREAVRMGFPPKAAAVLLVTDASESDGIRAFAAAHKLTKRETDLLAAITLTGDLKQAAAKIDLSYESARTYLKRIYEKTATRSQIDLLQKLHSGPLNVLRKRQTSDEEVHRVRRLMHLRDGRNLEYFILGPKDGKPVVHFDALAGITVDMVGCPAGVLAHLERHHIRLITPCRPGGFRSSPKPMNSLRDFTADIVELLDHLSVDRFAIFAVSFGAGSALAVAHDLHARVERVVLSAAPYPEYTPPNWRDLDLFYQMSGVLGRKWPAMLRQILPFLIRSVMQNVDRYFDRYISKTKSVADVAALSSPFLRSRMAAMLAERTAAGLSGMVEENVLNAQGWDFDVADIDVPIEIYHGALDNVAPLAGAILMTERLPNAQLTRLPEDGHYHHLTNWPWLMARAGGCEIGMGRDLYTIPEL